MKSIGVMLGVVVVYLICGYLIPFIEVPAKKTNEPKVIETYILTNGVHTDLVVPIKNDVKWIGGRTSFFIKILFQ